MNWQFGIAILFGLILFRFINQKGNEDKPVEEKITPSGFDVILPKTIDFENAQVTLVSGFKNYTKLNTSGRVHFPLNPIHLIDKVKVRTGGGKEYNYSEQHNPGRVVVDPIPCFECNFKGWRH